jgi:parvulin-like peptidyl-prolyl isomerase
MARKSLTGTAPFSLREKGDPPSEAPDRPRMARKRWLRILIGSLVVIALCAAIRRIGGGPEKAGAVLPQSAAKQASAGTAETLPRPAPTTASRRRNAVPGVVAVVNGRQITRDELAQEALRHYGAEVLDNLTKKYLIVAQCRRQNLSVTRAEVDREIQRLAARFKLPVDQWLKMIKSERGITPDQYAEDIIWPTLALKKLAGTNLQVTHEELVREYDILYGEMVRARLIAVKDRSQAESIRQAAVAHPDDFAELAKKFSQDQASAAGGGWIQPIRRHGSFPEIEKAAFSMADGDISPVIHVADQFVILKREGGIPPRDVKLESVASKLEELVRDRKVRAAAQDIFLKLSENARVEKCFDDPVKSQQMPGVAATINGRPMISVAELAQACIDRHGEEVLEGTINRTLLELECQKRGVQVSAQDMDQEIARAAALGVPPKSDGSPNVKAWLEEITRNEGISLEIYRRDVVWPSVALRKLAEGRVTVTPEDMQRGFESNYGPQARCLAIVLNNQRRAQEVFDLARKNNTAEYFGYLAEQYSIEPGSRALRGEVPPIKKWGGMPVLEDEAFALKPGELSGVIQVNDKFVILRCEGFTKPEVNVKPAEVQDLLHREIYEKKLHLAMGNYFKNLLAAAEIDNYLTGHSHEPDRRATPAEALRHVPGKG